MQIIGICVVLVGALMSLVFSIMLIIRAFQASIVWGLVYLFVPFGAFIFIITNWDKSWKPLMGMVLGIVLVFLGSMLLGDFLSDELSLDAPTHAIERTA